MSRVTENSELLLSYLSRQLEASFPDGELDAGHIKRSLGTALERLDHCLKHQRRSDAKTPHFDHLYSDHYALFLYYLSNQVFLQSGHCPEATKIYYLNKSLHGLDAYYDIELPAVMGVTHGVGTVLGRANYGDYLHVYHNVTIGVGLDGERPTIGRGVVLFPGAQILGSSKLGANVLVSAGTTVLNREIPDGHVVAGPNGRQIYPTSRVVLSEFFQ